MMKPLVAVGWLLLGAVACGAGETRPPAAETAPPPTVVYATATTATSPAPPPPQPAQREEAPPADPRLPEPGSGRSRREAYEQTGREIARLAQLLNEENRKVVERLGRNDTPEGLRVLAPIRARLRQAEAHSEHLLCRDTPLTSPNQTLAAMRIPLAGRVADSRWVDAYVDAKIADGDLKPADAADLRFVLSKAGWGVMNPSSLGADAVNRHIIQALACFGLSGPSRSRMTVKPTPTPPPRPRPTGNAPLRMYRTCGDPVCSGYRGPVPGVPRCGGQTAGAPCSRAGIRCDLGNNCNMQLICAATDPSTTCPR